MRFLVLILLFILLVISQINTIVDSDLWCHFKTGEYIVKNFNVPQMDIFSYTLENRAWVDHEWLSQALLYAVFAKFSWLGVNILKALVISLCFFILIFLLIFRYKKIVYAVLLALLSALAFGYRSFARPEMFSYLLLCLFFYVLEDERKIYVLPLLQVLWVNLHGYFILGPVLIFLYLLGEILSGNKAKSKRLGAVLCLAILGCFISPYFYKGAFYPINVLTGIFSGQKLYLRNIQELMMPLNAGFGKYVFFWILAILSSVTFLINLKKARMHHVLIFLGAFMASYIAVRNMPVFIFIAMPLAVINLNEASLTKGIIEKKYYAASVLIISAAICIFTSNMYYVFIKQSEFKHTGYKMSELLMPSKACDFLENNGIKGPMFNSIDFGHYISYRFYPEKRTFIDARTELYEDDFYKSYQKAHNYPREWETLQEKYNFDVALIRHIFSGTERILKYLYNSKDWVLVYYDEIAAVFLRDTSGNKKAIEKFRIDFSKKKIENPDETLRIAGFFEKIGEIQSAEDAYIKILESRPKFLEAGRSLAAIYISKGRTGEALEIIDKFLKYYPGSADLYCSKGAAYLRIGRKEEGLLMLEKSAKLDPYLRQTSYMLGLVYFEKGDLEKAERQFVKYLALDPYSANSHRILGNIYKQNGLLKEAAIEYNEADALEGKI
jgi:tetratricopeptide (TPR) repeat protein